MADICKHDWHFVHGTSDLECRRCGEVTGPRTAEQLAKDLAVFGTAWSQDGKRIDPVDVYKVPEYDTTKFIVPTGQLQIANIKPNYSLTFHNNHEGGTGKQVGKFDFNGPELLFEGDAAESAKVFVEWVARSFHGRLEQEREAGRQEALAAQEPVAYLCENAAGHRYFRWKKPSGMYKPIPLYTKEKKA